MTKFNLILILLLIGYIELGKLIFLMSAKNKLFILLVKSQCSKPFSYGDITTFCYSSDQTSLSWSDSYNQCLNNNGILIEIFSIQQFNALETINIQGKKLFWLGANNFASCK